MHNDTDMLKLIILTTTLIENDMVQLSLQLIQMKFTLLATT